MGVLADWTSTSGIHARSKGLGNGKGWQCLTRTCELKPDSFINDNLDSIYIHHDLTYEPYNSELNWAGNAIQLVHIHNSDCSRIARVFIVPELARFV